jgi:hypothetical protein
MWGEGEREQHGDMAWGGHGLPTISPRPAMPCPSTPCGRATLETTLRPFLWWPARRAGDLRLSSSLWYCPTPYVYGEQTGKSGDWVGERGKERVRGRGRRDQGQRTGTLSHQSFISALTQFKRLVACLVATKGLSSRHNDDVEIRIR